MNLKINADTADYFDNTIALDLLSLCVSTPLGKGVARDVYRSALNPDHVFKFELAKASFQNVLEWEAWDAVRHTRWAKWFAPIIHISPCGTVLIQQYAKDIEKEELPENVPYFFTDLKQENWGIIDGRPVCRDYGRSLLMDKGLNNRMRKADW